MLKIAFIFISLYAAIVFFLYLYQCQFIYFPSNFSPSPEEAGVPDMQIVTLKTDDGYDLMAWY